MTGGAVRIVIDVVMSLMMWFFGTVVTVFDGVVRFVMARL